jgi:Ras family protein
MIQIVYDKIINFCGVTQIPCVIVGSKADLELGFVPYGLPPPLAL